jgi:hypothetical protein
MTAGEAIPCASCGATIPRGARLTVHGGRWTHETPGDCVRPVVSASPVRPFVLLRGGAS